MLVSFPKDEKNPNVDLLGGKGIHITEMINAGFPVPEAFFITSKSYKQFVDKNKLKPKIMKIVNAADFSSVESLRNASDEIKELFSNVNYPSDIKQSVLKAYRELGDDSFVAVRSSSVLEDIAKTSAAGQQETFLNVKGDKEILDSVKKCWASLYTARSMYYRYKNKQPQDTSICVIIQRMVNSDSSGITFTVDPIHPVEGSDKMVIESCWGLGETIVQGQVDPDRYMVDKTTGKILEKIIGDKKIMRIRDVTGHTVIVDVPDDKRKVQVVKDEQIETIAKYCKKIEEFYEGRPQDIEWAIEKNKVYITQSRDITTLEKKEEMSEISGKLLVKGYGASPGAASGTVKIIKNIGELKKIKEGDILVTLMTSPDMVPAMEKASAIVTNEGGATCHAAIVSRELGIPCIVGTKNATKILKENQKVTVDAHHGRVFDGIVKIEKKKVKIAKNLKTKTLIKVNLAFPKTAKPEIAEKTDGVGLLRLEHMLTRAGMHPINYVRQGKSDELTKIIVDGVGKVAEVFKPKPVWVRTLDTRTDEFRNMKGGELEPKEDNPMLGWHGIRRGLDEPEIMKAQLKALKQLHEKGLKNIIVMIPFSHDVSQLRGVKRIAKEINYTGGFGVMVEVPSCALSIEEYCKEGIVFASFGSNDLTQLALGLDRNNQKLIKHFDELQTGMKHIFKYVIETCNKYNIETSICGEAPSNREDIVEFLIKTGIKSLSVNIDAMDKVRSQVSKIEKRLK